MKEHLHELFGRFLPILYNKYKKWLVESYSLMSDVMTKTERESKQQEAKCKLSKAAERITHSYLGIEHIFREFGQVYEAFISSSDLKLISSVKTNSNSSKSLSMTISAGAEV